MSSPQINYEIEENIIYGMVSGTALLADLYRPKHPNGVGLIHISGSGWHALRGYEARPLNRSGHVDIYVRPLAAAGFTVFTINHRAAPLFRFPAALEDAQRAVRFLRYHAADYGIRADRIGAIGGSSGGNLVSLLGVLPGDGDPKANDPIERESARVQCVVARAAPSDLVKAASGTVASYLGRRLEPPAEEDELYRAASPLYHVSANSAPFMLTHGTADEVVAMEQSTLMRDALQSQGIPVQLIEVEGGGHGPAFALEKLPDDLMPKIITWLQTQLLSQS